jgi:hypothetical protein
MYSPLHMTCIPSRHACSLCCEAGRVPEVLRVGCGQGPRNPGVVCVYVYTFGVCVCVHEAGVSLVKRTYVCIFVYNQYLQVHANS